MESALPPEWASITGLIRYVQKKSYSEYSSSCPFCQGEVHPDGSWPDRFRMFVDGKPRAFCRRCGKIAFPDQFGDNYQRPSVEELSRWREERIAAEEARKRSAERAILNLRNMHLLERYSDEMPRIGQQHWRDRGLTEFFISYYRLGYCPQFFYSSSQVMHESDSLVIPFFNQGNELMQLKHRLIHPAEGADKYRPEVHGIPCPLYRPHPEADLSNHVVVVEGEIKSMVVFQTLADGSPVVGLPGATPGKDVLEPLQSSDRITLIMDPGAERQASRLARILGLDRTRVLIPPQKIDDAIVALKLSAREIKAYIQSGFSARLYLSRKGA